MSQMDSFLPLLTTSDIMKKLSVSADVVKHLESTSDIECEDIGLFIDRIIPWTAQSNFRVAQNGLTILTLLAERMRSGFRPYLKDVLPHAVDRLGDPRDTVREKGRQLLARLMAGCLTPRQLFDRLAPALAHKSAKVREEMLLLLQEAVTVHGAGSIHLTPLVAPVVGLLGDPTPAVRDAAFSTLVTLYKHVGERLRHDLQRKHSVPSARLPALMAAFDAVRDSGAGPPTSRGAVTPGVRKESTDEVDRVAVSATSAARSTGIPTVRRSLTQKTSNGAVHSGGAGAIDEATFIASFEQVPRLQIFSPKELEDTMTRLRETLSQPSADWDSRTEALRKLRGVLVAGGADFDELYRHLRLMEPALQLSVQDLRSQVVREGCITIAYLSQQLGSRVDHLCHSLLPVLIELIPNSAKVMSTSGVVAIRFIIQHTQHARLIPIVTSQLSSKSREIRRACCEFLEQMITTWPTPALERHVAAIQEAIRRGVADADSEVRATSRRAYWGFADHFRQQADSLLNSLDPQHKRLLAGARSQSGSAGSLNTPGRRSRSTSQESLPSAVGLSRTGSTRRSGLPQPSPAPVDRGKSPAPPAFRSTSAIDLQAAQRASVRAQYAAAQRARAAAGPGSLLSSTPGPGRARPPPSSAGPQRTRSVTQSQPGSRSSSPSRLGLTGRGSPSESQTLGRRRRRSGIPRSTGPSRETSPHRQTPAGATGIRRPGVTGLSRPAAAADLLRQRRASESAPSDTPASVARWRSPVPDMFSEGSPSEAGSLSSGRSSLEPTPRRDAGGWNSGPQSLGSLPSSLPEVGDRPVGDVIEQAASTQWSERREGLLALQAVLRSNRMLTASELCRVTELFTKMFMDPHTKVFGVFLETVQELVIQHHDDLGDWLRVLVARLLTKLGADVLGSVVQKLEHTLSVVRSSFPASQQLQCVCHFLLDQYHTPNGRAKAAALRYLRALLDSMDAAELTGAEADLPAAVTKVLSWASDQKSVETRSAARAVIVALFELNTAEFTRVLQQVPKPCQDAATDIIQQHLRRRASVDQSAAQLRTRPGRDGDGGSPDPPTASTPEAPSDSDEQQQLAAALAALHLEPAEQWQPALHSLARLAATGSEQLWRDHYSAVLHLLLDSLQSGGAAREPVLAALTAMLRRDSIAGLLLPFSELLFRRVLEAQAEPAEREVARAAEQCAGALAARLPADAALRALGPLVQAGQFPLNRAAINTLTRLMEQREAAAVLGWLPELMPLLLKAYDNRESSVRKAAVFCIVTAHTVCGGSAVEPHLTALNATKMKLLRMYIARAQGATSPGDSPRGVDSPGESPRDTESPPK
ncbi:CLIP-associating protein 1-B-like [Amphibalanus amphitrite]|uniref:CLIP-associating protein 1-B-like n=1 Tax=Amphibalanus amphitrite TaxID=1232801 RepID=UPI001C90DD9A|nr:CLIP-associating protein 1-B-like [Amphibalanus amphitrite]